MTNHWSDLRNADAFMVCGCNCAENHPISWKWIQNARDKRGAKLVVVDPRFTRSASKADVFSFIRPGTDIVFFGGLINYAIEHNYIQWEYVQNYTNGPCLVVDGYGFDPVSGLFSGRQEGKTMGAAYDKGTWMIQYKDQEKKTGALRMPLIDVEDMVGFRGRPVGLGKAKHPRTGEEVDDPSACVVNRDHPLYSQSCFAKLEEHYSRYTPEMVEKVCGIPRAKFAELAEAYVKRTYLPCMSGNLMYAMGLTQHTIGVQNIRTFAVLQLLLGNTGLPGGGINALRGESNVQGSTDAALLYHIIPGYMPSPTSKEKDLETYNGASSPEKIGGWWVNRPKFMNSLLKCWWPRVAAEKGLPAAYDLLPKRDGAKDYSHIPLFEDMYQGIIKGCISWGQNPPVAGPNANLECAALDKLEWLAAIDLWDTEMMNFWQRPGADPKSIPTKVYSLPAASSIEKEGSVSNSGRVAQYRYKAVEPPGDAESDLWICDQLAQRLKALYEDDEKAPAREAITGLFWDYRRDGHGEVVVEDIDLELNGFTYPADVKGTDDFWEKAKKNTLLSFATLKDDGTTACCNWVYSGLYVKEGDALLETVAKAAGVDKATVTRNKLKWQYQADPNKIFPDQPGLQVYPYWAWCWPVNRRVIYNRCSADYNGEPWAMDKALVSWDGAKWVSNDVPDFIVGTAEAPNTPQATASGVDKGPFIMMDWKESQLGLLFTNKTNEGPFPEHYEPAESPVHNALSKQQNNPAVVLKYSSSDPEKGGDPEKYGLAEIGSKEYPYIGTTYRVTEHWQAGQMTRSLSWLGEAMPEMFVEISQALADEKGIRKGDLVEVSSLRGKVQGVAVVTPRLQPITVADGNGGSKEVHVVGMVWHFGFTGMFPGGREKGEFGKAAKRSYAANQVTPHVGDANTTIPEYKAFLVDVRKVS